MSMWEYALAPLQQTVLTGFSEGGAETAAALPAFMTAFAWRGG